MSSKPLWMTSLLLLSCGQPAQEEPTQPAASTQGVGTKPTAEGTSTNVPSLMKPGLQFRTLVPSPLEVEAAVRNAGVADNLSKLVPDRQFTEDKGDPPTVAVRTGVVLADAILAGKDAPKPALLERLNTMRSGLATIGAQTSMLERVDDLIMATTNDAASRHDFLETLNELSNDVAKSEVLGADSGMGQLIQAGAWLGGSHLVALALTQHSSEDATTTLFHQPDVVKYFLDFVKERAQGTDEGDVTPKLEAVLTTFSELSQKESLTLAEVRLVEEKTSELLDLL